MLQELLRMIDDVCNHRFSNTEGPSQSNPTEKQGPKTSVNSTLSSGELRAISDRLCFVPESTTVTGRPSTGSRTSEGEIGSGQHSVDNVLDGEMKTYIRPESPQNYESGFHNHPSPHPIVQGIPGVGIIRESVDASPSAIYLPFMGDARPRPSKKRTDSEFSATKQSLVAPVSTGALVTSRRDVPTIHRIPRLVDHMDYSMDSSTSVTKVNQARLPPSRKSETSSPPTRP
ncbi:hypothetical protein DFH94DRAFT_776869 [Russula ochroleuca]|uniref:Uncharacterized protein n=1 Tax=Russula ochroleuca TaxID=152965 RepID=A0A9P5JWZ5_9AGAM|nr:hypothetical protein DFH94DRAFT_776869 [Russula ochroleuca]